MCANNRSRVRLIHDVKYYTHWRSDGALVKLVQICEPQLKINNSRVLSARRISRGKSMGAGEWAGAGERERENGGSIEEIKIRAREPPPHAEWAMKDTDVLKATLSARSQKLHEPASGGWVESNIRNFNIGRFYLFSANNGTSYSFPASHSWPRKLLKQEKYSVSNSARALSRFSLISSASTNTKTRQWNK